MLIVAAFLLFLAAGTVYAGEAKENPCMSCHEDAAKAFSKTVHSALDGKLATKGKVSCQMCHGCGKAHIEAEGDAPMVNYKDGTAITKADACLDCHKTTTPGHFSSSHAKAGMACTDCHSVHKKSKMAHASKGCIKCHGDVWSKFQMTEHHRLKEGILGCTSCHNPHESSTVTRLGGFKHEACFKCHTDKQGPFLFEHGAVRIEGCEACHDPHGSVNRHMLNYQHVADMCYSCHITVPGWHSRFNQQANCTVCHLAIHGSNLSEGLIK